MRLGLGRAAPEGHDRVETSFRDLGASPLATGWRAFAWLALGAGVGLLAGSLGWGVAPLRRAVGMPGATP